LEWECRVADAREAAMARHALRDHLHARGVHGDVVDRVELIASELLTNAIVHTSAPALIELGVDDDHVLVRVTDSGTGRPVVQADDPTRIGGFGLRIVADLAVRWGVDPLPGGQEGKAVWAEIARHAPAIAAT
jgi:anti-sigma regulatory factor (Ser/Thr protein kinase)